MPHAELKYSDDLIFDVPGMFNLIEQTILGLDADAGACKCRAYPAPAFHHSHILISLSLLAKPHRNAAFSAALLAEMEPKLKAMLAAPCQFSLRLEYSPSTYITNLHDPAG